MSDSDGRRGRASSETASPRVGVGSPTCCWGAPRTVGRNRHHSVSGRVAVWRRGAGRARAQACAWVRPRGRRASALEQLEAHAASRRKQPAVWGLTSSRVAYEGVLDDGATVRAVGVPAPAEQLAGAVVACNRLPWVHVPRKCDSDVPSSTPLSQPPNPSPPAEGRAHAAVRCRHVPQNEVDAVRVEWERAGADGVRCYCEHARVRQRRPLAVGAVKRGRAGGQRARTGSRCVVVRRLCGVGRGQVAWLDVRAALPLHADVP